MYIIADVEWVENESNKKSPTQLAAVRVDEEWNFVDEFSSYIRPLDYTFHNWNHVAYAGGDPYNFVNAPSCYTVFEEFNQWVGEDTICWWWNQSACLHTQINRIVLKQNTTKPAIILSDYIRGFLDGKGRSRGNAYKLARARNIAVPSVEHNSHNDVIAIISLLIGISFPQKALLKPPVQPAPRYNSPMCETLAYQYDATNGLLHKKGCPMFPKNADRLGYSTLATPLRKGYRPCFCVREEMRLARREKVIDVLKRVPYTYLYTEHGQVFHSRDCGLLRNACHVLGTTKYRTVVAKGLRPCKVCHPAPQYARELAPIRRKAPPIPLPANTPTPKTAKEKNPELATRSLTRPERAAIARMQQSQKERYSGVLDTELTAQEKEDFYTLTQPRFGFFAAKGYRNFHLRNCTRLVGKDRILGFNTFSHARHAGFTPCKQCKPTEKQDILVSIPIDNMVRDDETIDDLEVLCEQFGYAYRYQKGVFQLSTPAGKWKVHTDSRPVTLEHINLVRSPGCERYHQQHRIFLSMIDALRYIHKHDSALLVRAEKGRKGVS